MVSRAGIEPATPGVRIPFSTAELPAHVWRKGKESNLGGCYPGYGLANRHFAAQSTFHVCAPHDGRVMRCMVIRGVSTHRSTRAFGSTTRYPPP